MRRAMGRCPIDHKATFRTFDAARGAAGRIGLTRVYWCAWAGGWHVTGASRSDYDRDRARGAA